jgi:hypothetical protein
VEGGATGPEAVERVVRRMPPASDPPSAPHRTCTDNRWRGKRVVRGVLTLTLLYALAAVSISAGVSLPVLARSSII